MSLCRGAPAAAVTGGAGLSGTAGAGLLGVQGLGGASGVETLDATDFHILRELWVGSGTYFRTDRVSLEEVARKVGVHRSTVAARLAKWQRTGFLERFSIDLDPCALGLVGANVQLHARARPLERALDVAAQVEGAQGIMVFDHGWVAVLLWADGPAALARTLSLLKGILEADEELPVANTALDFPDAKPVPLSATDVRLLLALREDARRTPADLAELTGVSVRTVERRLERMRAEEVFYVLPRVRLSEAPGMVVGFLRIGLPERGREAALRAVFAAVPNWVVRQAQTPRVARFAVFGRTLPELHATLDAVARVPGVEEVVLRLATGFREGAHFDAWLRERLERHARA